MAFPPTSPLFARALTERNYTEATPVQTAVLATEAAERDLLVSAQTGSGKTVAYGLALASTLVGDSPNLGRAGEPLALIVAPTRELALQVHGELTWLYKYAGARVVSCVGGMDPRQERRQLAEGCHIVVGTPGRLRDHLERHNLKVINLKAVVLDEADEMLDLGFREDLEFILQNTPKERRTLLFSATLPREIVALAKSYQRDAFRIAASGTERGHADIEYRAMRIAGHDTEHAVVNVLRFFESPGALVFCNTREAVRHLHAILLERGFSVVTLSGELSQSERNHALQALRDGRARVCVATDVAARGIDLPNLGLVIHVDLPNDAETLQHRSGRTGRAGRKGVSVLLITPAKRRRAESLLSTARIQAIWAGPPSADDIRKLDQERLLQSPLLTEPGQDDDLAMAKVLLGQRSAEEIATALVRVYRAQLPAAEDVSDPGAGSPPRQLDYARKHERGPARSGEPKGAGFNAPENTVWFRLNVGRSKNADPKWLIPEICRQGEITRREIGAIRIFDHETKFEVDEKVATKFAELIKRPVKGGVYIGPTEAPTSGGGRGPRNPSPPQSGERNDASGGKKHWQRKGPGQADTPQPRDDRAQQDNVKQDSPKQDSKPPYTKKPFGDKSPGDKSIGGKPFAGKPYGNKSQGGKPFGGKPFGGKPYAGKPSTAKPSEGKPRDAKANEDRPRQAKPYKGKPSGGKPWSTHKKPPKGKKGPR